MSSKRTNAPHKPHNPIQTIRYQSTKCRRHPIPQTCVESVRHPPDKKIHGTQIQHLLKRRPLDITLNETDGAQIEVPSKISTKRGERWL